jgi:hypothetical protein
LPSAVSSTMKSPADTSPITRIRNCPDATVGLHQIAGYGSGVPYGHPGTTVVRRAPVCSRVRSIGVGDARACAGALDQAAGVKKIGRREMPAQGDGPTAWCLHRAAPPTGDTCAGERPACRLIGGCRRPPSSRLVGLSMRTAVLHLTDCRLG